MRVLSKQMNGGLAHFPNPQSDLDRPATIRPLQYLDGFTGHIKPNGMMRRIVDHETDYFAEKPHSTSIPNHRLQPREKSILNRPGFAGGSNS